MTSKFWTNGQSLVGEAGSHINSYYYLKVASFLSVRQLRMTLCKKPGFDKYDAVKNPTVLHSATTA